MIEGITILNQTEIMELVGWYTPLILTLILVGFVLISVGGILSTIHKNKWIGAVLIVIGMILFLSILILETIRPEESIGRYKYECLIDDSASMTEVYEKYEVVEKRGEIWVLEDKE